MEIANTQCCAVEEIYELSYTGENAKEAMQAFCREVIDNGSSYLELRKSAADKTVKPGAFYIFTGVVRIKGGGDPVSELNYGPNFAAYIEKHNLGTVVSTPPRINRLNHKTHLVKVWVWAPDEKNLNKWWKKNAD